jgi:hypothetical protein
MSVRGWKAVFENGKIGGGGVWLLFWVTDRRMSSVIVCERGGGGELFIEEGVGWMVY